MTQPLPLVASLAGPAGAPVLVLGNSLGTTREVWEPQGADRLLLRHLAGRDDRDVANVSQPGEVTAALLAHLTSPRGA